MHEVFAKGGELLLRETEFAIAKGYAAIDRRVISTGAGVVLNRIILDYLKMPDGKIFFLNATFQTIATRLVNDILRPLFKNVVEAKSLYYFRQPLYLKYADQVIEVDTKSVEEIAQEISMTQRLVCKILSSSYHYEIEIGSGLLNCQAQYLNSLASKFAIHHR